MKRKGICRGAVYKGFAQDQSMGAEDDDDHGLKPQRVAPLSVTSTLSCYSPGMPHYIKFDPSVYSEYDPDYKWYAEEGAFIIDNRVT
ncbi:unnamed protein product [Penicillium camemberti]|uniref:Str. FM013 n=1 Tax=Penicillium camemberti (strain FM 013) TaxID=1429867 RepID=A0A0G4PUY3_PENC3|nr:unnamed protein product [Penicillium camemberti]